MQIKPKCKPQHSMKDPVFGILYNLIIGLLCFCIAIMLFSYVLFEWNQADNTPFIQSAVVKYWEVQELKSKLYFQKC